MAFTDFFAKPKKIPARLLLILLTGGASIILGFLSFSGMYTLIPLLPLAIASFVLSVAYEGEIYLKNLQGAFKKLFKYSYLERSLAKEHLFEHFPENTADEECPAFFREYEAQLKLLNAFSHKNLNKESKQRKKRIEKTLSAMEKWYAAQLFPAKDEAGENISVRAQKLRAWLAKSKQKEWQEKLKTRYFRFRLMQGFSALAGIFMGFGTTYLIVEAFSLIPFFATISFTLWPIFIIPMAIIAGTAYGFLTFNAVSDLINNNTLGKWFQNLRADFAKGNYWRFGFMAFATLVLGALAIALTVFTAGTWWTVASSAQPLFEWMTKIPTFVMGVINPIIIGISAVFFTVQNAVEGLNLIDEESRKEKNFIVRLYERICRSVKHAWETENLFQFFNPFRLLVQITVIPLRIIFFIGHLIGISVTADRAPGIPQEVSIVDAFVSELLEDWHYFFGNDEDDHDHGHGCHGHHDHHNHSHSDSHKITTKQLLAERLGVSGGHSHDTDIPTWLIKTAALPLYVLSAGYDWVFSKLNSPKDENALPQLSLRQAWNKHRGNKPEENVELSANASSTTHEWKQEHIILLIDRQQKKLESSFVGKNLAMAKVTKLKQLKDQVRTASTDEELGTILTTASKLPVYNENRLFQTWEKTGTQTCVEQLAEKSGLSDLPRMAAAAG